MVSHCFLNGSASKSTVGRETKNNIISILCCLKSKLLVLTVWKKSAWSQSSIFLNYYEHSFWLYSFLLSKLTRSQRKTIELFLFFLLKGAALHFKWILWNLAVHGLLLLVIWNMNFLDQCLSNFNVHMNHLGFLINKPLIQKVPYRAWDVPFLTSSGWCW